MKKLLVLIALTVLSCSKDEPGCNCEKTTYETKTTITFDSNGMPRTNIRNEIISTEVVPCQDEKQVNDGVRYYVIRCD